METTDTEVKLRLGDRKGSAKRLRGLAKTDMPPPTDAEVAVMLYHVRSRNRDFCRGGGSPTMPANNLPSQKPAPTGILWLIDRT
jgi:hypothetical protein